MLAGITSVEKQGCWIWTACVLCVLLYVDSSVLHTVAPQKGTGVGVGLSPSDSEIWPERIDFTLLASIFPNLEKEDMQNQFIFLIFMRSSGILCLHSKDKFPFI